VKPKAHLAFDKKKPHNKCTTDLFCDWQTEVCRCLFTLNTAVLNGVFGNWLNEEWRYLLTLNDPVWYFLLLTLHWQVMPKITTSLNLTLSIGWYRSQSNVDSETCTTLNYQTRHSRQQYLTWTDIYTPLSASHRTRQWYIYYVFFFYQKPSELLVSLGVRLSVIASFITFWYSPAKLLLKLHCKWNLACQWWFWGGASNEPKNGKFDKYF
jgi:hypothetical protein